MKTEKENNSLTLHLQSDSMVDATQLVAHNASIVSVISLRQLVEGHRPLPKGRLEEPPRDFPAVLSPRYIWGWVSCNETFTINCWIEFGYI